MALYSVDKLMVEARKLAAEYRKTTGKPLGISSEIAKFDVARLMGLESVDPTQSGGYDAIGTGERNGKLVQIKGRAILEEKKSGQRIGQLKVDQEWDSVMLVMMNEEYEPIEIYEAQRSKLLSFASVRLLYKVFKQCQTVIFRSRKISHKAQVT